MKREEIKKDIEDMLDLAFVISEYSKDESWYLKLSNVTEKKMKYLLNMSILKDKTREINNFLSYLANLLRLKLKEFGIDIEILFKKHNVLGHSTEIKRLDDLANQLSIFVGDYDFYINKYIYSSERNLKEIEKDKRLTDDNLIRINNIINSLREKIKKELQKKELNYSILEKYLNKQ